MISKIGHRAAVYRTERVAGFAFPRRFSRSSALRQRDFSEAWKCTEQSGFRLLIGTSGALPRAEWPSTVERDPLTLSGNRSERDSLDSKSLATSRSVEES